MALAGFIVPDALRNVLKISAAAVFAAFRKPPGHNLSSVARPTQKSRPVAACETYRQSQILRYFSSIWVWLSDPVRF